MDEVYDRLVDFHRALQAFLEGVRATRAALGAAHEAVAPQWNDDARKAFDARYVPLEERLTQFVTSDGPKDIAFLEARIRHLGDYLGRNA